MQSRSSRVILAVLTAISLAAPALFTAGCAGTLVTSPPSLEDVQAVFSAAKFTGAPTKSPYEYYSAEIFLNKAKHERELGNEKLANLYLTKAHNQARIAYENARRYQRAE